MAFATAGAITGVPGSPTPVGFSVEGTICTSIWGGSLMRSDKGEIQIATANKLTKAPVGEIA
jgi:hypothetical protein